MSDRLVLWLGKLEFNIVIINSIKPATFKEQWISKILNSKKSIFALNWKFENVNVIP